MQCLILTVLLIVCVSINQGQTCGNTVRPINPIPSMDKWSNAKHYMTRWHGNRTQKVPTFWNMHLTNFLGAQHHIFVQPIYCLQIWNNIQKMKFTSTLTYILDIYGCDLMFKIGYLLWINFAAVYSKFGNGRAHGLSEWVHPQILAHQPTPCLPCIPTTLVWRFTK